MGFNSAFKGLKEAGYAPGPVWTGGKFRPHRDSIPDRPALSQSLYTTGYIYIYIHTYVYLKSKENPELHTC